MSGNSATRRKAQRASARKIDNWMKNECNRLGIDPQGRYSYAFAFPATLSPDLKAVYKRYKDPQ